VKSADISVDLVHHVGDDLDVVDAARVSFNKQSDWEEVAYDEIVAGEYRVFSEYRLKDKDKKLVNYLAKNKHHSPFNHSFLSFRVKAPIFVARQLVKHKFMPWNEVSRRYVDDEPEFFFPRGWRAKAENVKQGSADVYIDPSQPDYELNIFTKATTGRALENYQALLDAGVCAEQARLILPQNMMTEWRWSGTLGAFLDMLVLRLDPHTQKETRDVAEKIAVHVKQLFPVSYTAYLGDS
jgi:thymidylate synthase (FAD)